MALSDLNMGPRNHSMMRVPVPAQYLDQLTDEEYAWTLNPQGPMPMGGVLQMLSGQSPQQAMGQEGMANYQQSQQVDQQNRMDMANNAPRYQQPPGEGPRSIYSGTGTPPFQQGVPMFVKDQNSATGYREVQPNEYQGGFLGNVFGGSQPSSQSEYQNAVRAGKGTLQFPKFTPEQETALSRLQNLGMNQAEQYYGSNPYDFAPIEAQARRGFEQRTVPTIAARLAGMGSSTGSGQNMALRQTAQDFENDLGAQRSQYALSAGGLRQGGIGQLLGAGLEPRFDTYHTPKAPSFKSALGGGAGEATGAVISGGMRYLTGGY